MYKALVKMRNKKGFTLMELLIVVAIIAILAAIAIPTFSGALTKAKRGADEANARSLYAAVALAYMTDGSATFPADKTAAPDTEVDITYPATDGTVYHFNQTPEIVNGTDSWSISVTGSDGTTSTWEVPFTD